MPSLKLKNLFQPNNKTSTISDANIEDVATRNTRVAVDPTVFQVSPTASSHSPVEQIVVSENSKNTPVKSRQMLKPVEEVTPTDRGKHSAPVRLRIRRFLLKMSLFRIFIEIILSNVIAVVAIPFIASALLLVLLVRLSLSFYFKLRYKSRISLMGGADAAWAVQSFAHDNCFISLYILQGKCDLTKIRHRMLTTVLERKEEDGSMTYERLRQRIVQKCGFYCWQSMDDFRVEDHVKFITNDATVEMTEQQVFAQIQSWIDTPLSDDSPQWQMLVVPKFIYKNNNQKIITNSNENGHYALVWRINHSIMDGISASNGLQYCIADSPVRLTLDPLEPLKTPFYVDLIIYMKILIFGARSFIRSMLLDDSNCFHGPVLTGPKRLYWSQPVSVEALKAIKNATRTSTTAVLISCVGGSLKNVAIKKNLPVPNTITAGTTVAMLPYQNILPQNRFTVAHVPIELEHDTLGERLESAFKSAKDLAGSSDVLKNFTLIRLTGLCPAFAIRSLMNNCQATLLLSNIPGPAEYYHLFQGDKLVDTTAWNTIKGKTGIGLCLFSYAGRVRAGLIADGAVLPEATDVRTLVEEFENELKDLAAHTGIPLNSLFTSC